MDGVDAGNLVQEEFSGLPRRLYSASPSRLLAWLDCPRQYRLRYLDRPRPAPRAQRAHTTVGTVTHQVLRDFWDLGPADRTPAGVSALIDRAWGEWGPGGFRDREQSQRWRERVRWQVLAYLRRLDRERRPLGIERTVAFTTSDAAFAGRIDRLDDRDGQLVVVDYKTGRRAPDDDEARTSLALALYARGAARVFRRPCTRVELHHLPSGAVAVHEHSEESLARKVGEASSIVSDLRRADAEYAEHGAGAAAFGARVSPLCTWCDMRAHCPEGSAYGIEKSSWAGLEGEDPGADAGDPPSPELLERT